MKRIFILLPFLAVGVAAGLAKAQDNAAAEKEVRQTLEEYGSAFSRGQASMSRPAFTQDAVYVTEDGTRVEGREAIIQRLRDYLTSHPGDRLRLTADKILFVTPEVAQVDGTAEIRGPGGPPDVSPYTALLVKREGHWQIKSMRDLSLSDDDEGATAADRLPELDWMVGEWTQTSEGGSVRATCRYDMEKNFLLWDYTVRASGKDVMTVNQRVGWDPQKGQFRSWVFDSAGGFAEGQWDPGDDGAWIIHQSGVLPDGGTASATCTLTPVERNSFRWRMAERRVDGQRLPDVDLRFAKSGSGGSPK
jgi:uncharacterized protein (TIGR02246 family)